MKVALLDVNVLVALAWPTHIHHEAAHRWFNQEQHHGWATCPFTQSALVRLSSNPKILADAVSLADALALLKALTAIPSHQFWADHLAVLDGAVFQPGYVVGHRQMTDAYLYSLAIDRDARLVTFDQSLQSLYPSAAEKYLWVLKA